MIWDVDNLKNNNIPTEECLNKYGVKRKVTEGYRAGKSAAELSEEYGLSITSIYRYLRK